MKVVSVNGVKILHTKQGRYDFNSPQACKTRLFSPANCGIAWYKGKNCEVI